MSKLKELKFNITTGNYSELGHVVFYKKDTPLKVDIAKSTLTLSNGTVVKISVTASSSYSGYPPLYGFVTADATHASGCWCSLGAGNSWWKVTFETPLPITEIHKLTFCCGQGHGTYPATYELVATYTDDSQKVIGKMYVNSNNGIFELPHANIVVYRNNKWYYKKSKGESV